MDSDHLYAFDESIRKNGFSIIAGIDEAGRGPLAGPVVAAAVILSTRIRIDGIRDSKKIRQKERESLFYKILVSAEDIGLGIVDSEEIDKINILNATKLAMEKALEDLRLMPDLILIDALTLKSIKTKQISLIKGESKSASIAAASIIAKVIRDGIIMSYHEKYPQYGFDKHKGYATVFHLERIKEYGPCTIHRKSFKKVMDIMLPFY
jgi:ribonuclease HII